MHGVQVSRMFAWVLKLCLFVRVCIACVGMWLFVQDLASRPSSQMSHTPSSGYGSARSTNRTISEVVSANDSQTATPHGPQGRSRNSLLNSLHKPKAADAGLRFRSLRVPRAVPSSSPGGNDSAEFACQPSENAETITLPLHTVTSHEENLQHEQQLSIPVPAPRFHTLKRHAYQNMPAPLKNSQSQNQEHQDNQNQFMQVMMAPKGVHFWGAWLFFLIIYLHLSGHEYVKFHFFLFRRLNSVHASYVDSAGAGRHIFCRRCSLY
jgi:hypothetical protein